MAICQNTKFNPSYNPKTTKDKMSITLKRRITNVAVCIDSSGSMSYLAKEAVDSFNAMVETLKTQSNKLGEEVNLSLYTFGDRVTKVFGLRPIDLVVKLSQSEYLANGGTPLFESCYNAMLDLQAAEVKGADVANLMTVITDGQENSSNYTKKNAFIGAIPGLIGTDRWTITFSVPRGGKQYLTGFGIQPGNIQEWDQTEEGMKVATVNNNTGYANYLGLRSQGVSSTKGFFTANVDAQKAKAAKKKLDDVRSDFKEMTVRTQDPKTLQEFIEARGLTFVKGKSFYQLTKAEKVQSNKEVLLREIKTGAIYGGRDARDILGLPDGTDVKVKPADHGDWDVFVQSTSNNRKLMAGTNLLYLK